MIKSIVAFIFTFLLVIATFSYNQNDKQLEVGVNDAFAAGCTNCDAGSEECHRVIVGNEVHIFYGEASDCPEEKEELGEA